VSGVVLPADQAPLAGVALLLGDEPAVRAASGGQGESVAVGDAARPLFLAALARSSARRPIVVAVPTATEAERIAHDLRQLLGAGAVEQFPAWETLPFERVSPALETMGRRMRVLSRLRNVAASSASDPLVVVAPIRALVQRLGPHVADVEPVAVSPGGRLDRDEFVARLVEIGYRREYQVEARGEVAVRGSIVDVYPVTADHPVRIDLWGDEVERLTEFSIADQRSTVECAAVTIFPAREILPTADVRARAAALVTEQP
jgi:transcription-repair coupling factor (superfamily II helicase)